MTKKEKEIVIDLAVKVRHLQKLHPDLVDIAYTLWLLGTGDKIY